MPKNKIYHLICMTFNGDYVIADRRHGNFNSVDDAWEYAEDMGSLWFFYPFRFIVNEFMNTIVSAPYEMEYMEGRRLQTITDFFKRIAGLPEAADINCEEFPSLLYSVWREDGMGT